MFCIHLTFLKVNSIAVDPFLTHCVWSDPWLQSSLFLNLSQHFSLLAGFLSSAVKTHIYSVFLKLIHRLASGRRACEPHQSGPRPSTRKLKVNLYIISHMQPKILQPKPLDITSEQLSTHSNSLQNLSHAHNAMQYNDG